MILTVNIPYQVQTVGLNPFQLVLVGTVLELTAFLAEVPTGIVADIYSRHKRSSGRRPCLQIIVVLIIALVVMYGLA